MVFKTKSKTKRIYFKDLKQFFSASVKVFSGENKVHFKIYFSLLLFY